jgi:hypothetical protein
LAIKKKVVLIPHWIQETLRRNPMVTLADCVDFTKMRELLSVSDLVGFSALQGEPFGKKLIGPDIYFGDLVMLWFASIPNDNRELNEFLGRTVCALDNQESFRKELEGRLFEAEARLPQYESPFCVHDLTPEVVGVVLYPGFFVGTNTKELQLELLRAILKVLYVYDTYSEVAQTSLFKRYLELLRTQ